MQFHKSSAEVYVADNTPIEQALERTTHLGISAHQDDLEIMAYDGIVKCFGSKTNWFTGVVVSDGAGSPRDGIYANYTDDEMRKVRRQEQKKAAFVGEYGAQVLLDYASSEIKDPKENAVVDDLSKLISAAKPSVVYTHNLADKHDTHVAVSLRVIQALRSLPVDTRPDALYGCEVWKDLDWLTDQDKAVFDVSGHQNIAAALIGVHDSQIYGGKRYDIATLGRRQAHATYHASHGTDMAQALIFAMDLTPLMNDATLDPAGYIASYIDRFKSEVLQRINSMREP